MLTGDLGNAQNRRHHLVQIRGFDARYPPHMPNLFASLTAELET
jgi:hypothetical protein